MIAPKEGSLYWYTGASASRQTFAESGAAILTNGRLTNGRDSNAKTLVEHRGDSRPLGRPLPRPGVQTLNPDKGPGGALNAAERCLREGNDSCNSLV